MNIKIELIIIFIIMALQINLSAIEEIEGVVESVLANEIVVEINSYNEPNIGDRVEISDEIPDLGKVALSGEFEVSKTAPNSITVISKGDDAGIPQPGYSVIIYSTNEIRKEDLETKHEFFAPKADESIKYDNGAEQSNKQWNLPSGKFHKVWADFDVFQEGRKGMLIHSKFNIANFQNVSLTYRVLFFDKDGNPLKDFNNNYRDRKGNVVISQTVIPEFSDTTFEDFQSFIPYDELHLPKGRNDLIYKIRLFNANNINQEYIIQSKGHEFYYTLSEIEKSINGNIETVWVDHNIMQNGQKGMLVHTKFHVKQFKGDKCSLNIYFYDSKGNPLRDFNKRYRTASNNVSVHENFTPVYEETTFNDFKLFMPYSELHMSKGSYKLMFMIKLYNYRLKKMFAGSDNTYFNYNS